jgi:hypothetical protein
MDSSYALQRRKQQQQQHRYAKIIATHHKRFTQ